MELGLEYFGVITGLLYLLLEIRQHRSMWIVGFLSSLTYVFVFFYSKFYADMGLSVYYVLISIYGFWRWSLRRQPQVAEQSVEADAILYQHVTPRLALPIALSLFCIYGVIYYILSRFTDSPIPYGDSFTTAVGIVATWMLTRRIVEHWLFWVVANFVSTYLYYTRGLYPTMFLYICYAILSIVGFYTWRKKGIEKDDKTL